FLHEVIRRGGEALLVGADRVQATVDSVVRTSVDRLTQASAAPEDMALLRSRLAELEAALAELESRADAPKGSGRSRKTAR
ncbi:MAG: hypothetical protein NTW40_08225, partial [Acidobacteria bacterium]|nr:hypothetical protein [Acidobacteriota bacterium]